MATIRQFEDIEAWQLARQLTCEIYRLSNQGSFARDYGLKDQIRRASVSIMASIAEGFERGGNREFRQFLAIAKGSAGEVRSHLYAALDSGTITEEQFKDLLDRVAGISSRIANFMRYLGRSSIEGSKFRRDTTEAPAKGIRRKNSEP